MTRSIPTTRSRPSTLQLRLSPGCDRWDDLEAGVLASTLEAVKYAALVVLGEDFLTIDADRIRYVHSLRTIVGRQVIWSSRGPAG